MYISQQQTWRVGKVLLLSTGVILLGTVACGATTTTAATAETGVLAPCPDSPNCVSTQSDPADQTHYIAPIAYTGSLAAAREQLLAIIADLPRTKVILTKENYLHTEFRSRIFRFVDDVEFYFDDEAKVIHFRSASRVGYGDLGVNRKRMEEIREKWRVASGG
ncbi:MAG: DUF1499 domain-containing protein [Caldilineaceae bacterium]